MINQTNTNTHKRKAHISTRRGVLRNQTGAMFGLDARIAMIIFSILSVGIGLVSFNRIQTAKDMALLKELTAISESIQSFQYDMRTFYPFALNKSLESEDLSALWDKNKVSYNLQSRWNGPYYTKTTTKHEIYGNYGLEYLPDDMTKRCSYENTCYVWITLTDVDEDAWKHLNHYVDENLEDNTETEGREHLQGIVRADTFNGVRKLYFRSISAK